MAVAEAGSGRIPWGRWTPPRLIAVGALLAAVPVVLDAAVTLSSNLAVLSGALNGTPFWLALLDATLVGFLIPVGFFLVLCGILLAVLASRPPRPRVFRIGLGGAGVSLAAGLLLGMLNLSWYLLPVDVYTLDFLRNLALTGFVASLAAGLGTLVAFCGIAAAVRPEPLARSEGTAVRIRAARGKSIYEAAPSAR